MTHRAHAVLAAAAAASLLLPACSGRVPHDEEVIRDRAADFDRLTSSRDFSVRKSPFLGTRSLPLSDENAPALMQQVTMKSRGSFSDIVEVLRRIAPVTVTVAADPDDAAAEKPGSLLRLAGMNPRSTTCSREGISSLPGHRPSASATTAPCAASSIR